MPAPSASRLNRLQRVLGCLCIVGLRCLAHRLHVFDDRAPCPSQKACPQAISRDFLGGLQLLEYLLCLLQRSLTLGSRCILSCYIAVDHISSLERQGNRFVCRCAFSHQNPRLGALGL